MKNQDRTTTSKYKFANKKQAAREENICTASSSNPKRICPSQEASSIACKSATNQERRRRPTASGSSPEIDAARAELKPSRLRPQPTERLGKTMIGRRASSKSSNLEPMSSRAFLLLFLLLIIERSCDILLPTRGDAFILRDQKLLKAAGNKTNILADSSTRKLLVKTQTSANNKRNPTQKGFVEEVLNEPSNLAISITPRVSQVRVPVESNAILKCLISSQSNKFTKKFDIRWSRYMYDESVYEQIDTLSGFDGSGEQASDSTTTSASVENGYFLSGAEPPELRPINRQQQLRDFLTRIRKETNTISDLLIEATLSISPVKAQDNASYFCTATDGISDQNKARIELVALSKPVVHLERVHPARDSKSALIYWLILSDGNTPITKTILMIRNDTSRRIDFQQQPQVDQEPQHLASNVVIDSDYNHWQRIDIADDGERANSYLVDQQATLERDSHNEPQSNERLDDVVRADVDVTSSSFGSGQQEPRSEQDGARARWKLSSRFNKRQRAFNLSSLLPGVTYNFRLAAINDMGQSNWTYLTATMPNEIPAQISEVFLLSRSNDSLAIGWRRPVYDGAKTLRYEMQLFDLNRTLTLDANTNTSSISSKKNFMYLFVSLNPGTDYHFHVRACSRAGCSAYSSPKLFASTLDGESDEPIDVELNCQQLDSERLAASWLPPINIRGQLVSYEVSFQSAARYRNESTQWTLDEWRSTMETNDNHTLSLETSIKPMPNTNYSVRVCANNRSKHCGRVSSSSPRSQCATPPELPAEFPPGIRLLNKNIANIGRTQLTSNEPVESLVLELPFITRRNGTFSCIQIVLIRLPKSYSSDKSLRTFLPNEPSDIKLSQPFESSESTSPAKASGESETAVAYLAEELLDNSADSNEQQDVIQQIVLGDGTQQVCGNSAAPDQSKFRVFDGSLKAKTFYTGFIKLSLNRNQLGSSKRSVETLSKFSEYFEPVQTGDSVIEVPILSYPNDVSNNQTTLPFDALNAQMNLKEMANRLRLSIGLNMRKLYNQTSAYLRDSVKLEAIGNYVMQSSPLTQLFQVGVFVLVLVLFLLFVIYLLTLPASIRRKRKRKMKRQLARHQEAAAAANTQSYLDPGPLQTHANGTLTGQANAAAAFQQQLGGAAVMQGYQQQVEPQAYSQSPRLNGQQHRDCPVHSSPMAGSHQHQHHHNCQTMHQPSYEEGQPSHQHHHHQHHHHQHHNKQLNYSEHELSRQEQQYERNCRTLRSRNQLAFQTQTGANPLDGAPVDKNTFTLGHQNLIVGLAKRFNKSIPIRLFGAVFERRLRQGWLAEEYEQLPQPPVEQNAPEEAEGAETGGQVGNRWLKLKPQMVVSRDDTVSALISGRDKIDASLIKPPHSPNNSTRALLQKPEKRIICAKSPLDADSVWDFWRLVYEQEVSTLVMLTQTEDVNSGEVRCAQYWPTQDNEETTILSPCNDFVQKSTILPAKFKIRQETLEPGDGEESNFKIRRLTLVVMATKASENDLQAERRSVQSHETGTSANDDDELIIVERSLWHLQYYHWNTSSLPNQMRLIKFIELANERHIRSQVQESPTAPSTLGPMLVHCYTGVGRSGLFTAMSYIIDELSMKLNQGQLDQQQQQPPQVQKLNIFQIVSRLRLQRDMLVGPYRFYELLYQLSLNCIPNRELITAQIRC